MLLKITLNRARELLETYSLEELLDYNGLEEADILKALVEQGVIELPETEPL